MIHCRLLRCFCCICPDGCLTASPSHMASITLALIYPLRSSSSRCSLPGGLRTLSETKPQTLTLSHPPNRCNLLAASSSPPPPPIPTGNHTLSPLTGSTRTITTIIGVIKVLASKISVPFLKLAPFLPNPSTLATVARPAFFAAISDSIAPKSTGAPIAVIAAGLARWLEIYSCVLLIRVLLSWFPNIPWEKQPMSAIRDLCDPYLSLFRGIIPPLFNSLDVSPILAFLLLGLVGQLARPPRPY